MGALTTNELLAAIRVLPLDERLRLIEKATQDAAEDTPNPAVVAATRGASLIGLMADEPDLVDQMCSLIYEARGAAKMRTIDE